MVLTVFVLLIMVPQQEDGEVFHDDWVAYVLAAMWGFNCGLTVCSSIMLIAATFEQPQEKGVASTMALTTLQVGLVCASMLGMLLNECCLKSFEWHARPA